MVDFILEARQRRSVRRAVDAQCQVVADRGFRLLGTRATDVSPEGMLVRGEGPGADDVQVGDSVFVALRAPNGVSWIDAEAEVTRIALGRRQSDEGRAVGLRFKRMDRVSRTVLLSSLRGLPPPLPARHLRRDYASTIRLIQMW